MELPPDPPHVPCRAEAGPFRDPIHAQSRPRLDVCGLVAAPVRMCHREGQRRLGHVVHGPAAVRCMPGGGLAALLGADAVLGQPDSSPVPTRALCFVLWTALGCIRTGSSVRTWPAAGENGPAAAVWNTCSTGTPHVAAPSINARSRSRKRARSVSDKSGHASQRIVWPTHPVCEASRRRSQRQMTTFGECLPILRPFVATPASKWLVLCNCRQRPPASCFCK